MKKTLIQKLGLLGVVSFLSYTAALSLLRLPAARRRAPGIAPPCSP